MVQQHQEMGPQLPWIREQVGNGRYTLSEHMVRLLTSRKLEMEDMESVLINGEIVEYRRNARKQIGSLVSGRSGETQLSLLCEKADDNTLSVLLGILSPAPQWERDAKGRIEDGVMQETKRRCFFCGGEIKQIVVGNFDYRLDGDLFVVKNVPAGLCLTCGEKYVESAVAHGINNRVKSGEYSSTDMVRVIEYGGL